MDLLSLIIPVYKNEENLDRLLREIEGLNEKIGRNLEVVFVVDGSPDRSLEILGERLPNWRVRAQLISLSRNFGAFPAIAAGLACGTGDYFAVLAADLQEPPELVFEFWETLRSGEADVVFGCRTGRDDPPVSRFLSWIFWSFYRGFVLKDLPAGGVDIFGCNRVVRDQVLLFKEADSNLIALFLWVGFRRKFVPYFRRARREGTSAWTIRKKIKYALDSIFNFTDLPLRVLLISGAAGTLLSAAASAIVLVGRLMGRIVVSGYTPIILIVAFFGGLTTLGLGLIGQYTWLSLQNARGRPGYIISTSRVFRAADEAAGGHDSD